MACDIDLFDLPAFVDPINDIEHVIDEALQQLPGAFQDASFFWQLTSGHGIKLGGRVRLWFWLSRPTTNRELKNWLSSSKADPSVFAIVQPIYTAAPILPPGTPDLLPARSGVRAGANDEVDVPPPDVLSRHHGAYRNMDGAGGFVAATVEAALACMGDPPAYPHGRGFHAPVKAALSAAIRSAGSKVDQAALLARIDAALIERGHTRPEAYISARIRDARSWLDWFVRKAFENEAVHAAGPAACDAPSTHPTMETEGITAILNNAIGSFMDDAIVTSRARQSVEKTLAETNDWTGFGRPVAPLGQTALVAAGVACGKTEVALQQAARVLAVKEPRGTPKRRIAYIAPDHNLGDEVAARFRALAPGIPCHVHYGASWPDPTHPDFSNPAISAADKVKMCRRSEMLADTRKAGGSISTLCGSEKRGFCPHHPDHPDAATNGVCGRMKAAVPKSGIVVLSGPDALTEAPPGMARTISVQVETADETGAIILKRQRTSIDPADLAIIDEPKPLTWLANSKEVSPERLITPLQRFEGDDPRPGDDAASHDVSAALIALADEIADLKPGKLPAGVVRRIAAIADWRTIKKAALRFKPIPENHVRPNMPAAEIAKVLGKLKVHAAPVFSISRLCDTIEAACDALTPFPDDALSGLISVEPFEEKRGQTLLLRGRKALAEAWGGMPTLLLDGTADTDLLRRWFPRLSVIADVQLPTPQAVTRRQIWNSPFGYTGWVPEDPVPPTPDATLTERAGTAWNNVRWLMRLLAVRATQYRGQGQDEIDVLAIVPLGTEKALRALWEPLGGPPQGLAIEHWNAIRGLDKYRGVRAAVLVSRVQPSAAELETIAWTLTGVQGVTVPNGLLPKVEAAYLMRDGTGRQAMVARHPDYTAEAVRRAICDNELVQGDGRPRPGRRDADSPLLVEILTNVPTGLPIDELITRSDLEADATHARWSLSCGICPVPGSKGFAAVMAAIEGRSERAVEISLERNPDTYAPLAEFAGCAEKSAGWLLVNVKLTADDRFAVPVWVRSFVPEYAPALLRKVGVVPHFVEPANTETPDPFEAMAKEGVEPESPGDAALLFRDVFSSPEAARQVFRRRGEVSDKSGFKPLKPHIEYTSYMGFEGFERAFVTHLFQRLQDTFTVTYQPAGPGKRSRTLRANWRGLRGLRSRLTRSVGQLAVFRIAASDGAEVPTSLADGQTLMEQVLAIVRRLVEGPDDVPDEFGTNQLTPAVGGAQPSTLT